MHGDIADQGNEVAERNLSASLAAVQAAAARPLPSTGKCLHCDEPLSAGMRWCDAHCRDGYEREQAARKRNGTA